jgi:hypothetical protein
MSTDYSRLFSTFTLVSDYDSWYSYLEPEWHTDAKPCMRDEIHHAYAYAIFQCLADNNRLRVRRVTGESDDEKNGHFTDILDANGNVVESITGTTCYGKSYCNEIVQYTEQEDDDYITIALIVDAVSVPNLPEFYTVDGKSIDLYSNFVSDLYVTFNIVIRRDCVTDEFH